MPYITVAWANPQQTAILVTYTTIGWTWADLKGAIKEQHDLIDTVTHPVDILVDVRKSNWLPSGGSLLSLSRDMAAARHPRQRNTVIIGARGFLAGIVNGLVKLSRGYIRNFHFASTIEEGYALLAQLEKSAKVR